MSTLAELREARAIVRDVAAELVAEGHAVRENLPVGIMVEVPAAALMADHLAKEVDFFSIGTNDLIQYTLAVDRTNETVAELYSAADPSVLRLIAMVVEAARVHGIEVTVCGKMGGEPLYTMLLLGLGLRQLSMPPHQLPEVRRVIRGVRIETARAVAAEALRLETAQAVTALLESCAPPGTARYARYARAGSLRDAVTQFDATGYLGDHPFFSGSRPTAALPPDCDQGSYRNRLCAGPPNTNRFVNPKDPSRATSCPARRPRCPAAVQAGFPAFCCATLDRLDPRVPDRLLPRGAVRTDRSADRRAKSHRFVVSRQVAGHDHSHQAASPIRQAR